MGFEAANLGSDFSLSLSYFPSLGLSLSLRGLDHIAGTWLVCECVFDYP